MPLHIDFNRSTEYHTVTDIESTRYYSQGGFYYTLDGRKLSAIPASALNSVAPPIDLSINPMISGVKQLKRTITSAVTEDLTSDGAALGANNFWMIPQSSIKRVRVIVTARTAAALSGGTGLSAIWETVVMVQRGAALGSSGIVGGVTSMAPTLSVGTASTWRLDIAVKTSAGNGQGGLLLKGTGDGTTSVIWVATLEPV